jgi:DNA repair exonuclease SbcCD ATPase subunit
MHKTSAGEKRKALKAEALELARDAKAAMRASRTLPEARKKARTLEGQADSLMAEAETLKGAARLEDLHVWQMQKVKTTKGSKIYGYWMASWREGGKTRNIHLGSCMKTDAEAAMQKARKMKTEALGISEI